MEKEQRYTHVSQHGTMLRQATDAEAVRMNCENFAAWGGKLTQAQYLQREVLLHTHAWSRGEARKRTWVLAAAADSDELLSGCETYETSAQCKLDSGEVRCGVVHEIASVFTPPRHRGKGYASAMLRGVVSDALAHHDCLGLTLYSDIGSDYYAKLGFSAWSPPSDVLWQAGDGGTVCGDAAGGSSSTTALTGFPTEPLLTRRMGAQQLAGGELTVVPSGNQLAWHAASAAFHAQAEGRADPTAPGVVVGCKVVTTGGRISGEVYWCPDKTGDELLLLWLDGDDDAAVTSLISAAKSHAANCGAKTVRAWHLPQLFSAAALSSTGGAIVSRTGKLPMLLPKLVDTRTLVGVQRGVWV